MMKADLPLIVSRLLSMDSIVASLFAAAKGGRGRTVGHSRGGRAEIRRLGRLGRQSEIGEEAGHPSSCPPPVRNAILFFLREFGDAFAEFGQENDGVVSEAARAARNPQKFAGTGLLDDEDALLVEDQGEGADEGAAPVLEGLAVPEKEGVALGRIELAPSVLRSVAGRNDAGRPAEGMDREARVVGERGAAGEGIEGPGLDQGIFDIGSPILFDIKGRMTDVRGPPEPVAGEEGSEFGEFMRVACRDKEFHGGRLAWAATAGQGWSCFLR